MGKKADNQKQTPPLEASENTQQNNETAEQKSDNNTQEQTATMHETPKLEEAKSSGKPPVQEPVEPASAKKSPSLEPAPVIIKQGGKSLSVLALVLSLIALGCAGLLFVEGRNTLHNTERDWQSKLNESALGQSENARLLRESLQNTAHLQDKADGLTTSLGKLDARVATQEKAYQKLAVSRVQWVLNETEYTLNSAARQLMLTGDTEAAIGVLADLEGRLNRFQSPELLRVKQGISQDLGYLKKQENTDIVALSLRLERLASQADKLPFMMDSILAANTPQIHTSDKPSDLPWYQAWWQEIKGNMGNIVQVRKIKDDAVMQLSADQAYFVRQVIALKLIDARLALIKQQPALYQSDLAAARQTAERYFDVQSTEVKNWLAELNSMSTVSVGVKKVDLLTHSLAAVREQQAVFHSQDDGEQLPAPVVQAAKSQTQAEVETAKSEPVKAVQAASPEVNVVDSAEQKAESTKAKEENQTPKLARELESNKAKEKAEQKTETKTTEQKASEEEATEKTETAKPVIQEVIETAKDTAKGAQ